MPSLIARQLSETIVVVLGKLQKAVQVSKLFRKKTHLLLRSPEANLSQMQRNSRRRFAVFFATFFLPVAAQAQIISLSTHDPALLQLGVGEYNFIRYHTDAPSSTLFRAEYRFAAQAFYLHPIVGVEATSRGSFYGYGGVAVNIFLFNSRIVLTPDEAIGVWERGGKDKDLGAPPEFRSGAELDYRFDDGARIGFSVHHISNAGLGQSNRGEEEEMAVFSVPLTGFP
jgi:lipid A 3-O-deacylase